MRLKGAMISCQQILDLLFKNYVAQVRRMCLFISHFVYPLPLYLSASPISGLRAVTRCNVRLLSFTKILRYVCGINYTTCIGPVTVSAHVSVQFLLRFSIG